MHRDYLRTVKPITSLTPTRAIYLRILLATVAFAKEQCPNCSKEEIIADIQNWTKRKRELMSERLISVSYDRLESFDI